MRSIAARILAPALAGVLVALPAAAQRPDSAAFIVRLGLDTTAVERYVRTGDRIDAMSVSRSPRTAVRRLTVWLAPDGSVARFATGAESGELRETTPAAPGIPLVGGFYLPWELGLLQAFAAGADSTAVNMLSGTRPVPIPFRRLAPDRFAFANQFDQPIRARTDRAGRLQYLEIEGGGATVERVRWADLESLAREFAARDEAGNGLGPLSPLDSTTATVAGARVTVRYSRPALRGRDIGALLPTGQVWRTGANNATELHTDRTLRFGSVTLAPGTYSLFTIPRADGWTLIINGQTGQSGLEYDQGRDVGRVEMTVQPLPAFTDRFTIRVEPAAGAGLLRLLWGGSEARIRFQVEG